MTIKLATVLSIPEPERYKAHLACWNQHDQPLDVFVRDRAEWREWNTWRSKKDDFNREFIFSLIDFYPEPGIWLFGGIFRVLSRGGKDYSHSYTIELEPLGQEYIGRLKVKLKRPGRVKAVRLERYFSQMDVAEILKEPYSGEAFCGYENIAHDFNQLEAVFRASRPDWRAALENVKGVYLIADKSNGKKYVGSAYGDMGVWSRWACYIGTGHGWNDELTRIVDVEGIDYARRNFRISLLEHWSMKTDDKVLIERESYWKEAVLSRGKHGYNKN